MKTTLPILCLAFLVAAQPADLKAGAAKTAELAKNVTLEILPSGQRRVLIQGEVCFREGSLELFLCRKYTKEHESVVVADVDGREVHKALIAAGAKPGSPVKFEPKYQKATGTAMKVFVRYAKDGKEVTVNAREWIRDAKTGKDLATDWVFGGSFFYPDQSDAKKPPLYAANGGDLVCVSNFATAMLDLPVESSADDSERGYTAHTARIPPLGTKVTVVLEPQAEKKEEKGAEKK